MRTRTSAAVTLEYETACWTRGISWLAGVDECGRGSLAGPVVCGAVVLSPQCDPAAFEGVRDSKQLSNKRIREIADRARSGVYAASGLFAWGIGAASPREIDRLNIRRATALAMQRAIASAERALVHKVPGAKIHHAIIDGVPMPELETPHDAIVGGDRVSLSIALASCLAVDCRRTLMRKLAGHHPEFACWGQDYGYGSPAHLEALRRHRPIPGIHRVSFGPVRQLSLF